MKTIEQIRAELEDELRARQRDTRLIKLALAALTYGDPERPSDDSGSWMTPGPDEEHVEPIPLASVRVPPEEGQRIHDAIDHEAHAGERKTWQESQTLTAGGRDAIVALCKGKGTITVKMLAEEMGGAVSWARAQLAAALVKGIVEKVDPNAKRGTTFEYRYVVPSAQKAAAERHRRREVVKRAKGPVPGTGKGKKISGDKEVRELGRVAEAAGLEVKRTAGGHASVAGRTISRGGGRKRRNMQAQIKRESPSP